MAKKGDKFLERIKKDVKDIDHGKLKHHHKHKEQHHQIHHTEHKENHPKHHMKHETGKIKHESIHEPVEHKMKSENHTEKILSENLIALQKIMANLALSIDNLSKRISKLLDLFEISARTLAEKDYELGKDVKMEKELSQKIDTLIEHNKIFAKGLTLLHERQEIGTEHRSQPLPQIGIPQPTQMTKQIESENYQKSISSKP